MGHVAAKASGKGQHAYKEESQSILLSLDWNIENIKPWGR